MSAANPWVSTDEGRPPLTIVDAPVRGREHPSIGRRQMRRYRDALAIADGVVVALSIVVAVVMRFGLDGASVDVLGMSADYWLIGSLIALAWYLGLSAHRSRDVRIIGSGPSEYRRVMNATVMVFGFAAIVLLLLKVDIARSFFIVAFPLGLGGVLIARWTGRRILMRLRRGGRYTSATVVIGSTPDVERVLGSIAAHPGSAFRPVGVVLDDRDDLAELRVRRHRAVPVIGRLDEIGDVIRANKIDTVIVAGQPSGGGELIRSIGWELERTDAELMIASRLTDVAGPRIHFRPAEGLPLMHVELPSYEGGKHLVKRVFDFTVATTSLILLAPLFAGIAIWVRAHDGGPAFFTQQRVGRNGRMFPMYKFRTMVPDAEARLAALRDQDEGNGVLFKMRDDPRVTGPGRILRKYSLDELPQLWNVVRGDMSLVGPRPPLQSEVDAYERHVLRRLYIKPGLTGMWQINGRSDLSWEDSVRLDLYYVENWSLAGDLVILWRTARIVFRPVGAY